MKLGIRQTVDRFGAYIRKSAEINSQYDRATADDLYQETILRVADFDFKSERWGDVPNSFAKRKIKSATIDAFRVIIRANNRNRPVMLKSHPTYKSDHHFEACLSEARELLPPRLLRAFDAVRCGMTKAEYARSAGLSPATVSRIFTEIRNYVDDCI